LLAPAGTPSDVIARLNQAVNAALKDPKVRQRMHDLGAVIVGGTPQEFHDYLLADQKRWAHVIQAAGIKME
jgi:tripartite-type tricarboxylate transporter receptor subunit TctC